jgi:hypothetical protein
MKTTATFLLLAFSSLLGFSQSKSEARQIKQLEAIYQSEIFLISDLIMTPEFYNPENDSTITAIEFFQDTLNNINKAYLIFSAISPRDGFNQKYTIGSIYDYQTGLFEISLTMKVYYASGVISTSYHKIHFDNLPNPVEDIESAQYSVDPLWLDGSEDIVLN